MLVRARAPLRLGLAGGGTDVSPFCDQFGGCIMNATIDKYAYASLEMLDNGRVEFIASDLQASWKGFAEPKLDTGTVLGLHMAVYNRIVKDFYNHRPISLRLTTFSDAPPGSGLGSSSTLVVAMVKAFQELLNLPLGDYEVARLAYEIERKDMQLLGGRQDQYAATFGGFNFMEFYDNDRVIVNPLRIKDWIISELEASLILYFTGISRDSAMIIDEQSHGVESKKVNILEAMRGVKQQAIVMKEALLKGNFTGLIEAFRSGWEFKKNTAHNITNQKIDKVIEQAMIAGAKAAKISGAGGGGFLMLLTDPICRAKVIRVLDQMGGQVINCHFTNHGALGWRIG